MQPRIHKSILREKLMTTHQENDQLTRVGPGTVTGDLVVPEANHAPSLPA